MSSSPAGPFLSPSRTGRRKERRNPSVTPRRFGRFFTPRSAMPGGVCIRRPLERIDSAAVNRQPISPQSLASDPITADAMCSSPTERVTRASDAAKRRCPDTPMQALKKRRGYAMDDVALPPLSIPGFPQEEVDEVKSANIQDASWLSRQGPDALGDRRKATLVRIVLVQLSFLYQLTLITESLFQSQSQRWPTQLRRKVCPYHARCRSRRHLCSFCKPPTPPTTYLPCQSLTTNADPRRLPTKAHPQIPQPRLRIPAPKPRTRLLSTAWRAPSRHARLRPTIRDSLLLQPQQRYTQLRFVHRPGQHHSL